MAATDRHIPVQTGYPVLPDLPFTVSKQEHSMPPDPAAVPAATPELTSEQLALLIRLAESYRAGTVAWRWLVTLGSLALGVAAFFYYLRQGLAPWLIR
jgi:hypothetical protein